MATGDQQDFFQRIKTLVPRWFGDSMPTIDALVQGLAWAGSFVYSLWAYAKLQTRILTATDGWLDMIAADFFGAALLRQSNQSDASFRARIVINLFRERATRGGIVKVLQDLTGRTPLVFEPLRPADTGCYGGPAIGYGMAGGYGSMLLPFQALVTAYRPTGLGIPLVAGYGISTGGYGQASRADYAAMSMIQGAVTDADIYAAIDSVKPAGTIIWTRINS
jgi:hypothetical protein